MAVVEKFNKFIDEVNAIQGTEIPHGITVLDCMNNYLAETGATEEKFDSVDNALYFLATLVGDVVINVNGVLEPAEPYLNTADAMAAFIEAYEEAIGG